jgi:hypothetical protein
VLAVSGLVEGQLSSRSRGNGIRDDLVSLPKRYPTLGMFVGRGLEDSAGKLGIYCAAKNTFHAIAIAVVP